MAFICARKIVGLWAINEPSNVWVRVTGLGWRKLDLFQKGEGKDVCQEVAVRAPRDQPKKSAGTRKKSQRPRSSRRQHR
jgi:hypothetical protein